MNVDALNRNSMGLATNDDDFAKKVPNIQTMQDFKHEYQNLNITIQTGK
jgi:hypothetical protein